MPLAVRASCLAAGVVSYRPRSVDWTCASRLCAPTREAARSVPRRANASATRAKAGHASSRRACFTALFAARFLMERLRLAAGLATDGYQTSRALPLRPVCLAQLEGSRPMCPDWQPTLTGEKAHSLVPHHCLSSRPSSVGNTSTLRRLPGESPL